MLLSHLMSQLQQQKQRKPSRIAKLCTIMQSFDPIEPNDRKKIDRTAEITWNFLLSLTWYSNEMCDIQTQISLQPGSSWVVWIFRIFQVIKSVVLILLFATFDCKSSIQPLWPRLKHLIYIQFNACISSLSSPYCSFAVLSSPSHPSRLSYWLRLSVSFASCCAHAASRALDCTISTSMFMWPRVYVNILRALAIQRCTANAASTAAKAGNLLLTSPSSNEKRQVHLN